MIFATPLDPSDRPSTYTFGPAQGTVQAYGLEGFAGDDGVEPFDFSPSGVQAFYFADEDDVGGGTFRDHPLYAASEIVTIELRMISVTTEEFPRGLIGMRIYRRNGDDFYRGIPWDWDAPEALGDFFREIQQFGCGQFNTAPTASGLYTDVGGYVTIARDLGGWLGPRAGFVE